MARHFYKFNDGPHCPPSCVSLNRWSAHWYLLYRVTCHSSLNQGLINVDSRCQIEPLALFFDWFLFCPQFTCHISVLRRCYLKHQRLQITNHSISQKISHTDFPSISLPYFSFVSCWWWLISRMPEIKTFSSLGRPTITEWLHCLRPALELVDRGTYYRSIEYVYHLHKFTTLNGLSGVCVLALTLGT